MCQFYVSNLPTADPGFLRLDVVQFLIVNLSLSLSLPSWFCFSGGPRLLQMQLWKIKMLHIKQQYTFCRNTYPQTHGTSEPPLAIADGFSWVSAWITCSPSSPRCSHVKSWGRPCLDTLFKMAPTPQRFLFFPSALSFSWCLLHLNSVYYLVFHCASSTRM